MPPPACREQDVLCENVTTIRLNSRPVLARLQANHLGPLTNRCAESCRQGRETCNHLRGLHVMCTAQDQATGKHVAYVATCLCFEVCRRNRVVASFIKCISNLNRVRQHPEVRLGRRQQHDPLPQIAIGARLLDKPQQVALRCEAIPMPGLARPAAHKLVRVTKAGACSRCRQYTHATAGRSAAHVIRFDDSY